MGSAMTSTEVIVVRDELSHRFCGSIILSARCCADKIMIKQLKPSKDKHTTANVGNAFEASLWACTAFSSSLFSPFIFSYRPPYPCSLFLDLHWECRPQDFILTTLCPPLLFTQHFPSRNPNLMFWQGCRTRIGATMKRLVPIAILCALSAHHGTLIIAGRRGVSSLPRRNGHIWSQFQAMHMRVSGMSSYSAPSSEITHLIP